MLVCIAFWPGDRDQAVRLSDWMNELDSYPNHEMLILRDARCEPIPQLGESFGKTEEEIAKAVIDEWPMGADYFFRLIATAVSYKQGYNHFLWLEPDAIPLKKGWLDAIASEYQACHKPFMGDDVNVNDVPRHMSGIGVYPNPLVQYAGEAMRCHDVAWDIAAKNQIVPNAHFTKLITHAWKHETFTNPHELTTQMRPETVIFHSSKDGSLIKLLRQQKEGDAVSVPMTNPKGTSEAATTVQPAVAETFGTQGLAEPATPLNTSLSEIWNRKKGDANSRDTSRASITAASKVQSSDAAITDIFVRTYPGDYQWLLFCLDSIFKFTSGFRKIWVVSPEPPRGAMFTAYKDAIEWKVMNDESPDGYLAQQITKLYADVITDYQPDYILHVDSDVIFTQPTAPHDFLYADLNVEVPQWKPIWYYTPYKAIETPWQPITEAFMKREIDNEFMRRFPIMIPRWLYPRLREFCMKKHGRIISEHIRNQPHRAFSEFNALGAYAWTFHKDKFHWVNTLEVELPPPVAKQFYSWGGVDKVKSEIDQILSGDRSLTTLEVEPQTEEKIRSEPKSHDSSPERESRAQNISKGIKELPNGIWVIESDTHVSKWVEQQNRLDHDQNLLPFILPEIKEGDVVVDAGAFIGDHTIAYARKVGEKGYVYAFEPNPIAAQCLRHNLFSFDNVATYERGLGDKEENSAPISGNNNNYGGCYIGEHMKLAKVLIERFDDWFASREDRRDPNFIKLDIEGFEVKALEGMKKTIDRCHPKLVIEVNTVALGRQGNYPGEIFSFLKNHGYEYKILQENCGKTDLMYDILAVWVLAESGSREEPEVPSMCSDLHGSASVSSNGSPKEHIRALADYADLPWKRQYVIKALKTKWKKTRKKKVTV